MRTKGLRDFKQGLVSYKEEYKGKLNYKQWQFNMLKRGGNMTARMGKGNYSYGLLSRIWHWSCWCWLLLITADCWWLLLVAGWLVVAAGILLVAASCFWLLDDASCVWNTACRRRKSLWIFSGCWWFAAKTILQAKNSLNFLQDFDDLRLRQFCRRKSLWIFPGCWWYEAKTILQAKKSLNIFEEAMKKFGKTSFKIVLENFQSKN